MATYRLLHQNASHSDKVSQLSDFEFRVWMQYLLSADDYGVCPADAVRFQADNRALKAVPVRKVTAAIGRLLDVGLVQEFSHQAHCFLYQWDWQTWQRIRHPSKTILPCPPAEVLRKCCGETAELFRKHSGTISLARAGANANANANAKDLDLPEGEPEREPPRTRNATLIRRRNLNAAFEWRADVLMSQHQEFIGRLGGDSTVAETRLFAWYAEVAKQWGDDKPIGDNPFKFWAFRFEEWQGTTKGTETKPDNTERIAIQKAREFGIKEGWTQAQVDASIADIRRKVAELAQRKAI